MHRKEEAMISPEGIGSNNRVVGEREREVEGESESFAAGVATGSGEDRSAERENTRHIC